MASAWPAELEDRRLRLLVRAVLASLVLHALILSVLPLLREGKLQVPAPALTARLAKPRPPEPELAQPAPRTEPQPVRAARPPQAMKPVAQPLPQPAPAPILSMEPAKQAGEPALSVPAPAAATAQAVPSLSSPAPAAKTDASAAQAAGGPDAGNVARFRLELMDIARRYKRYPRIAQDNNWEGRVELRIAFGEDGAISSLSVKRGSGRTVLDDEAQSMMRVAKSKVSIPPALRGRAFAIEIPVDFFLREEEK